METSTKIDDLFKTLRVKRHNARDEEKQNLDGVQEDVHRDGGAGDDAQGRGKDGFTNVGQQVGVNNAFDSLNRILKFRDGGSIETKRASDGSDGERGGAQPKKKIRHVEEKSPSVNDGHDGDSKPGDYGNDTSREYDHVDNDGVEGVQDEEVVDDRNKNQHRDEESWMDEKDTDKAHDDVKSIISTIVFNDAIRNRKKSRPAEDEEDEAGYDNEQQSSTQPS